MRACRDRWVTRRRLVRLGLLAQDAGHLVRLESRDGVPVLVVVSRRGAVEEVVVRRPAASSDVYVHARSGVELGDCRFVVGAAAQLEATLMFEEWRARLVPR